MTRNFWVGLVVAPAIALGACGGSTAGGDGGTGGDGAAGCPASAPPDGTSCGAAGLECEYAGSAQFCSRIASCNGGVFSHKDGVCGTSGATCPQTKAQVQLGQACTQAVTCDYVDGRCGCAFPPGPVQIDGGGLRWVCSTAPSGCPSERPLLGTSCATDGQVCDYGACSLGGNGDPYGTPLARKCSGGVWTRTFIACPK